MKINFSYDIRQLYESGLKWVSGSLIVCRHRFCASRGTGMCAHCADNKMAVTHRARYFASENRARHTDTRTVVCNKGPCVNYKSEECYCCSSNLRSTKINGNYFESIATYR